ncbi:hypothetical protein K435DRAFT_847004 [Dendrothele bispora CBS 962.96]|uniref:Uncharacterized protein n=1 Tax=Dendrothele bispora (strain CBS 962.96) TaxID=1314807 RepID=A0A4S8M6W3_DENBC|nr:hypothetical protein K435DRAFT_857484 [Dendrothele bispora CBS 962.96]THV08095.1 hypothetical protein K435DRAFT_847004 [Dendrothele bispora CBS 962.96]
MELTDYGVTRDFGFDWVQPHFSGIYMASIILLVSKKQSYSETIFAKSQSLTANDDDDDDDSIQFAMNSNISGHTLTAAPSGSYPAEGYSRTGQIFMGVLA